MMEPKFHSTSGRKYVNKNGISAIKDGVKRSKHIELVDITKGRKPPWLKAKIPNGKRFLKVRETVQSRGLSTVCEESKCPNIGECWNHGTATIMLMGSVCTRACRFCSVDTGNPNGWLDHEEPSKVAESVHLMQLKYVVLTSVDRDDLEDGGASHYAHCIREIREKNTGTIIEALTPDFHGSSTAIRTLVNSGLHVFAHNIETVRRLTPAVRDPRASYKQTLHVLKEAKRLRNNVKTKSSLMLGLGETKHEIEETMRNLRDIGVDLLTLGQYLQPTANHLRVKRWISPNEFEMYRDLALNIGFTDVASGPLVRSSYRADELAKKIELQNLSKQK